VQGCAANPFEDRVNINSIDGVDIVTRNPELDAIVLRDSRAQDQFCMSPETDAVPTQSVGFALNLTGQGSASETSGDGAASLGGRSEAVLITREILYRTCEFTLNHNLSEDDALTLFEKALDTAQAVATANTATGTAEANDQPTAPAAPSAPGGS
jgi:hypothetical protein